MDFALNDKCDEKTTHVAKKVGKNVDRKQASGEEVLNAHT